MANALPAMVRRGRITPEQAMQSFSIFKTIPVQMVKVNTGNALELAYRYRCYAYDAYYMEVARRLDTPLMTMDQQLTRNGTDFGITVINISEK